MPIHLHSDAHPINQNDDYAFALRPDSSRYFSRSRRFGNEGDIYNRAMSQTSSPLRLSQVGNSPHSSFEQFQTARGRSKYDVSPIHNRREQLSGAARQALAYCGELDEDDAYYKARRSFMTKSPLGFGYDESNDVEQHTSLPSESMRMSPCNQWKATGSWVRPHSRATTMPSLEKSRELKESSRQCEFEDNDTDNYATFLSKRPSDGAIAEEEAAMREMSSYIAKRKQFAVEDEDDVQKLRHKKYEAQLENSGTYRVSAQNHKGEISSYATLLVRRYGGEKTGYYDGKSGYNIRKPTDYPDVENLEVPEQTSAKSPKQEDKSDLTKAPANVVYSGISAEVGDGKYETVLEFQIPGTHHAQEAKRFSLQESTIEPIRLLNRQLGCGMADVDESIVQEQWKEEIYPKEVAPEQAYNKNPDNEKDHLAQNKSPPFSNTKEIENFSHGLAVSICDISSPADANKANIQDIVTEETPQTNELANVSKPVGEVVLQGNE